MNLIPLLSSISQKPSFRMILTKLQMITGRSQSKLFERLMEKELLVKISRGKYRLYHTMFLEFLRMMKKGTK